MKFFVCLSVLCSSSCKEIWASKKEGFQYSQIGLQGIVWFDYCDCIDYLLQFYNDALYNMTFELSWVWVCALVYKIVWCNILPSGTKYAIYAFDLFSPYWSAHYNATHYLNLLQEQDCTWKNSSQVQGISVSNLICTVKPPF